MLETLISEQIKYLGIAQHLWMKKTNNWSGFPRAAIEQHYCYHLLNIPFSRDLNLEDLDKFRAETDFLSNKYHLAALDAGALSLKTKDFRIKINDKSYGISEVPELNQLLKSAGSKFRICAGFHGGARSYIFGEIKKETVEGYNVSYTEKELARTPNNPLLIAAMMEGRDIFIREEAAELMFYQKWAKTFEMNSMQLSEKLIRKALSSFSIKNKDELMSQKDVFLKALMTNYLYHEIGHAASPLAVFLAEEAAFGEGCTVLGHNILTLILEFLSDFLINVKSPLNHIIELAESGKDSEAQRLFYLYLADNYFYETENYSLFPLTDFALAVCIKHIKKDRIDFAGLKKELDPANQNSIPDYLVEEYKNITLWLKEKIERTDFMVAGKPLDYKNLSLFVKAEHLKAKDFQNDLKYQSTIWANILKHIESYAGETYKQILYFLEEEKLKVSDILFNIIAEDNEIEEYKGNLRNYLRDRLTALI